MPGAWHVSDAERQAQAATLPDSGREFRITGCLLGQIRGQHIAAVLLRL